MIGSSSTGGVIPKEFIPAVEKGIRETLPSGVLAGYPVVDVKATLFFGSYHDVDSSEMAFKMAAIFGFKEGCRKASPVILEPMMAVEVETPEDYAGNVMGDLSSRRGMVQGMDDMVGGGFDLAELHLALGLTVLALTAVFRRWRHLLVFLCSLFFPDWLARVFVTFNGLFSNFLGFFVPVLFFALIAEAGPNRALVITFINPAVAVLLGVVLS